ncbi:MAG: hypothetical protein ABUS48_05645 [Pseudomonadota bacterium]
MNMRTLMIAGFIAATMISARPALAEDQPSVATTTFSEQPGAHTLNLSIGHERTDRSPNFAPNAPRERNRRYEMAIGAQDVGGLPVDVSIAQRASVGVDQNGEVSERGRGAELRLGRGIGMRRQKAASWDHPIWYGFVASDDEAVTWRPGVRNSFGDRAPSFALQDRVEIGDRQAGVTYERGPLQASLAYVERSVDGRSGGRTISHDERFIGFTLTMRH